MYLFEKGYPPAKAMLLALRAGKKQEFKIKNKNLYQQITPLGEFFVV